MEKLSSDILEEDFIKTFHPINTVQYWLGFQRANIKHKYVTGPSIYYQFYCSVLCLLNITFAAYFIFNCECRLQAASTVFFYKSGVIIIVLINSVIAWRNSFCNGNSNSQLYVKMQKIDRVLKMRGAAKANRKVFWFSVATIVCSFAMWAAGLVLLDITTMKAFCPALLFIQITGMGGFMEMILEACILLFIVMRLDHINVILEREATYLKNKLLEAKVSLPCNEHDRDNFKDHDKLAAGMFYILDSFSDFVTLFQFSLLSFMCHVITWDFTLMQSAVTAIKEKNFQLTDIHYVAISGGTFMLVMIGLTIVCAIANEITYKINQTRKVCFNVLSLTSDNEDLYEMQRKTEQILMLLDIKPSFTIYDLFTVDNRLPLHIFSITASYTIVLLQFATL